MRIVFFGSSEFALPALKAVYNRNYKILCVVTQPDKRQKRGLSLGSTPVKKMALELGLDIFQPVDVNTSEAKDFLRGLSSDLFVVVSFGQILSEQIINLPKIFSINLHPSLLPKYRGPAPINWALFNAEE
ncbi:MAG: methionyl-tRNA formyltransferase, partial [Candidatus Omnitrophica bacterium]|nr:methionyl-tRNA formyltransferase [Candidatus Omnitrophota bacterium]